MLATTHMTPWPEAESSKEIKPQAVSFSQLKQHVREFGVFRYASSILPYEFPYIRHSQDKTSTVNLEIEEALSEIRFIGILIPNVLDVKKYISNYADILGPLLNACEITAERFAVEVQLSLEVYHDPEIEDEYLALYVRKQKYDENIMKEIKKIRSLYGHSLIDKKGWLLVTTDFRYPKE